MVYHEINLTELIFCGVNKLLRKKLVKQLFLQGENMKKALFLFLFLVPTLCFADTLRVKKDANLRSQPSADSSVVTVINADTIVQGEKTSDNNDWYAITVDNTTGYIHKSLLQKATSGNDIIKGIKPFRSGLFWWIVIDKLILIGILCFFFATNPLKSILWIVATLASTAIIAFILKLLGFCGSFMQNFGFTALLAIGMVLMGSKKV